MSLTTEYIENLVFKFNTGNISPEELQILTDWYNNHNDQHVVIPTKQDESFDDTKSRILTGLLSKIANEQVHTVKMYPKLRWIVAAAAVFVITLGTWMVIDKKTAVQENSTVSTSIEPGGNKATLTLPDGRTITLSNSQSGIVTGEEITYVNGTPVENTDMRRTDEIQQLTLHTPRGGMYTIILQDGTQVWLNAASTIKYPSRFTSADRIIELEGEAYFQVKQAYQKNGEKIPFKVISNQQVVEVLGTEFNMNVYPDQASSKTTLVEGRVAIDDSKHHFVLAPNEQAVTTKGKTKVSQVAAGNYTAWRDGKFSFDGKTFEETMNEIGRWYDLDIVYQNGVPTEDLVGDAFRNQKISLVLRLLDVAEIDYNLDVASRKLTIKGKKNRM